MRLHKHLTESYYSVDAFWDNVQKKCKPFLKEWLPIVKTYPSRSWFLYRGIMNQSGNFGEKSVRSDRKPMNSEDSFHKDVNSAMYKTFKIHGRTASVFCTGNEIEASFYAKPFIIFPVGSYKYLWSPKISDLFAKRGLFGYKSFVYKGDPKEYEKSMKISRDANKIVIDDMMKTYKTTGLQEAIRSGHEIMIQCPSYMFLGTVYASDLQNIIDRMFE